MRVHTACGHGVGSVDSDARQRPGTLVALETDGTSFLTAFCGRGKNQQLLWTSGALAHEVH